MLRFAKLSVWTLLLCGACVAQGGVIPIDFNEIPTSTIPENYQSLTWDKLYAINKFAAPEDAYVTGTTSGDVSSWSAYPTVIIKSPEGTSFDALRANFTSVYGIQTIRFFGFKEGSHRGTSLGFEITPDGSREIAFGLSDIDELHITSPAGEHWVMDDFIISSDTIPEPGSLLGLLGLSVVVGLNRRR